ncbi:hypothetical protein BUALT_Bualt04G0018100 [Buddleja alternifolia]|uniref:Uncharacterized protein n=1 Tax=Buddleja alternifolia TaxID=168488 RepID=A0AAV6XLV9_9LAMI|nr:hypothetical protein BUALT_Bualt04G0018100 [Buddleja alternifolia]
MECLSLALAPVVSLTRKGRLSLAPVVSLGVVTVPASLQCATLPPVVASCWVCGITKWEGVLRRNGEDEVLLQLETECTMDPRFFRDCTHEYLMKFTDSFSDDNCIARFQFGKIYHGIIPHDFGPTQPVTVKIWDTSSSVIRDNELRLMVSF